MIENSQCPLLRSSVLIRCSSVDRLSQKRTQIHTGFFCCLCFMDGAYFSHLTSLCLKKHPCARTYYLTKYYTASPSLPSTPFLCYCALQQMRERERQRKVQYNGRRKCYFYRCFSCLPPNDPVELTCCSGLLCSAVVRTDCISDGRSEDRSPHQGWDSMVLSGSP